MAETRDLLHELADEHRDLTSTARRLVHEPAARAANSSAMAHLVEHELIHRLLVHPLLARDRWGRALLRDRREEQLLLADRLRRLAPDAGPAARPAPRPGRRGPLFAGTTAGRDLVRELAVLEGQLAEHTDREEILEFPHLRHSTELSELQAVTELSPRLREALRERLATRALVADARWATTRRRDLPHLLDLPEELTLALPDGRTRSAGVRSQREHGRTGGRTDRTAGPGGQRRDARSERPGTRRGQIDTITP